MRIASLPSRAWKWRIASFCAIWDPGSPVQAETPFAIVLATSFDQRSPQRLSVTLALSVVPPVHLPGGGDPVPRPGPGPRGVELARPHRADGGGGCDAAHRLAP